MALLSVCKTYGIVIFQPEPETEHVHESATVSEQPTCIFDGYVREYCTTCKEILHVQNLPAIGHILETDVQEATCTDRGFIREICTICNEIVLIDPISMIDHVASEEDPAICKFCGTEMPKS